MENATKEFLTRLLCANAPSGFEEEAGRIWRAEAESFGAETWTDAHGSSFARIGEGGRPRVMLAGHLDEIGFMVTHIDDKGFVWFQPIGGWDSQVPVGQRVWVRTKSGRIPAVMGKKPIHMLTPEDRDKVTKLEDMWLDVGAKDEEEARSLVAIGDPAVLAWDPVMLPNDRIVARGLDDRSGAFVVLEALRLLSGMDPKAEVVAVGTAQEEVGLRGAKTAAYGLDPEVGIAVDVTTATDQPEMDKDKRKRGDVRLGAGCVIARGANVNPHMFELLVDTAKAKGIPYQVDPAPRGTGTDANAIQLTRAGVATALISVPNRYMHSPCEMCALEDLEAAARLIAESVATLDGSSDFRIQ